MVRGHFKLESEIFDFRPSMDWNSIFQFIMILKLLENFKADDLEEFNDWYFIGLVFKQSISKNIKQ